MNTPSKFNILETSIYGVFQISRKPLSDQRGFLERLFCMSDLELLVGNRKIVQINRTLSKDVGLIRGLHYQIAPFAESKFVMCLSGRVFDIALDIRKNSPTFLNHLSVELSPDQNNILFIPEGFAHGFQTLSPNTEMLYFHTAQYNPQFERGINATDPRLEINWPLPTAHRSPRDLSHPMLNSDFEGF